MSDRVVLVDGSALVYRSFFAIPPHLTTKAGLHTNAVYGFATMFKKLFAGKRPSYGAVVFDPPGKTFRDEKYPQYKAQRAPMPDELKEQLVLIDRVVRANRFPMLRVFGYEADDVIGTLARQGRERGLEVVIVSSDKDFAQLITDGVRMQDTLKDVVYDRDLVKKKWGVWPEQMVDYLALMGDSSDNIPGVDGIGQKGAAQLLEEHGSLSALLAMLDAPVSTLKPRMQKALQAGRDSALLSRELATIDCSAPLETTVEELKLENADVAELNELYRELEFFSLLARDTAMAARAEQTSSSAPPPSVCASSADVAAWVQSTGQDALTAIVPLFEGGTHLTGRLFGLAVASASASAWIPVDAAGAADPRLLELAPFLQSPARLKVLHDAKEGIVGLFRLGITLRGVSFDTRLASFLVNPTKILPHTLEAVAKEYLQISLPRRRDLGSAQKGESPLANVPAEDVAAYAAELVRTVLDLEGVLRPLVIEAQQMPALTEVDLPLSFVLGEMELAGVGLDAMLLTDIGNDLRNRLGDVAKRIWAHAGREFNIASPKQMAEVLFEELKLPVVKRTKSGYSTDADVLERLAPRHPICREILEHRKLDKLINTYVDVLCRDVRPDGRVHPTFQQTTSATGRLITTDPDLQRTPVKTEEGGRIRRAFIAQPDRAGRPRQVVDADWSQIELRLLAHFSSDPVLIESFRTGADVHRRTAAGIFGKPPEQLTKAERDVGKTVNFATIYGQGAQALGHQLGVERKESQNYISRYFETYAGVARFVEESVRRAEERGYAETLLGRRRIIPELKSRSPMDRGFGERVAMNTPIQGSAADICKLAMLRIAAQLPQRAPSARMLLQIHDELLFECLPDEADVVAALVKDVMESVVQLQVPLVADVGVGGSWGDAK